PTRSFLEKSSSPLPIRRPVPMTSCSVPWVCCGLPAIMKLPRRWSDLLAVLHAQGRYRTLTAPHGIDFASNEYLGYANPSRTGAARLPAPTEGNGFESEGLPRSGMASRLLRDHHPVWDEVETALARCHGAEATLVMTSGYAANEGL